MKNGDRERVRSERGGKCVIATRSEAVWARQCIGRPVARPKAPNATSGQRGGRGGDCVNESWQGQKR